VKRSFKTYCQHTRTNTHKHTHVHTHMRAHTHTHCDTQSIPSCTHNCVIPTTGRSGGFKGGGGLEEGETLLGLSVCLSKVNSQSTDAKRLLHSETIWNKVEKFSLTIVVGVDSVVCEIPVSGVTLTLFRLCGAPST